MPRWPENPDEPVDPAFVDLSSTTPVLALMIGLAVGNDYALFIVTRHRQNLAEGFDVAESDLVEHAEHGDEHSTQPIWRDAAGFDTPEAADLDDDVYGIADDEDPET